MFFASIRVSFISCPRHARRSRAWLRLVTWAHNKVSPDYAEWVARTAPQIPGHLEQVFSLVSDLADWVRAGTKTEGSGLDQQEARGRQFVVRPFTPCMSLKTVTKLSADWHEAVASHMDGPEFAFPPPWYPAATVGNLEIIPIDSSAELYREGCAMHHCVGVYADKVKDGAAYIYSVRRDGTRLVTFELACNGSRASLIQLRGHCNTQAPKEIVAAVRKWLRAQAPLPPPDLAHRPAVDIPY